MRRSIADSLGNHAGCRRYTARCDAFGGIQIPFPERVVTVRDDDGDKLDPEALGG